MKSSRKIVITGGGSGGHTTTAIGVIEALLKKYPDTKDQIVYIGGQRGMEGDSRKGSFEERVAKERGLTFVPVRSGKLQRKVALRTVTGLFGVVGGFIDVFSYFSKNDICVVFSSGGYVSVPVCVVAALKRVPVVIHEQTTRVGLSNRISGWFARKILVGYPDAMEFFPKKKTTTVGNLLRKEILDRSYFDKPLLMKLRVFKKRSKQYPVVMIAGGGQGSHMLNTLVFMGLKSLLSHFQVILLTGDHGTYRDYDRIEKFLRTFSDSQRSRMHMVKYASASELGAMFDVADVFVGRSGALFVYELGAVSIPSVLIPIPWVTHNEQFHNAETLVSVGLAKIVSEGVMSPEILFQEIQRMISKVRTGQLRIDEDRRKEIFVKDADRKIVEELEEYLDV